MILNSRNNLFNFTDMAMRTLENIEFTSSGHGQFMCEVLQDVQRQKLKNIKLISAAY